MFWIVTSNRAYGGRSGLLPLLGLIVRASVMSFIKPEISPNRTFRGYCADSAMCSNKKYKVKRLFNLLRNGKKLNVRFVKSLKG